jgi:hypothetical protein
LWWLTIKETMKTKTLFGLVLLVTIQNLVQQVLAEDEPDLDELDDMEEEEPEVPVEFDTIVDEDEEPDVNDEEVAPPSSLIEDDEPEVHFEPEMHVVDKHSAYAGECEVIEQSPLGDDDVFFQFHQVLNI